MCTVYNVRYKEKTYFLSFTIPNIEALIRGKMSEQHLEFKKHDTNKLEYDLFPDSVLQDIVKIMMYGAYSKGYGKNNWQLCTNVNRYYNAARRHLETWREGEYNDVES